MSFGGWWMCRDLAKQRISWISAGGSKMIREKSVVIICLNMSKSYSSTIFDDRVEAFCRFLMILTYSYSTKAIQSFVVVLAYTASHIGQSLGFVSFVLVSIQVLRGISVFKRQGAAHLNLRPFKVDR